MASVGVLTSESHLHLYYGEFGLDNLYLGFEGALRVKHYSHNAWRTSAPCHLEEYACWEHYDFWDMSLFLQLVHYSSAFHSEEATELAGLLPFKEKLLYPPGEGMECYLEVSLCWHSRFRKTWRTQVAFTVGHSWNWWLQRAYSVTREMFDTFLPVHDSFQTLPGRDVYFSYQSWRSFCNKIRFLLSWQHWIPHTCFPQCRFLWVRMLENSLLIRNMWLWSSRNYCSQVTPTMTLNFNTLKQGWRGGLVSAAFGSSTGTWSW